MSNRVAWAFRSELQVGLDAIQLPSRTKRLNIFPADYIAPEVLQILENPKDFYGPECDWWSLGVVMWEMLCGELPFSGDSYVEIFSEIMQNKDLFDLPDDVELSDAGRDFLSRVLTDKKTRLGVNGPAEIKSHAWFKDIDWTILRSRRYNIFFRQSHV
jgi:serine/threonine protein kinase